MPTPTLCQNAAQAIKVHVEPIEEENVASVSSKESEFYPNGISAVNFVAPEPMVPDLPSIFINKPKESEHTRNKTSILLFNHSTL